MEDLRSVAWQEGKPDWANKGPPNVGDYNSFPTDVPFFEDGDGSFLSDYGHFFLVSHLVSSSLLIFCYYLTCVWVVVGMVQRSVVASCR